MRTALKAEAGAVEGLMEPEELAELELNHRLDVDVRVAHGVGNRLGSTFAAEGALVGRAIAGPETVARVVALTEQTAGIREGDTRVHLDLGDGGEFGAEVRDLAVGRADDHALGGGDDLGLGVNLGNTNLDDLRIGLRRGHVLPTSRLEIDNQTKRGVAHDLTVQE